MYIYTTNHMYSENEKRRNNPRPRPKHRYDKQLIVVNNISTNAIVTSVVYPAAVFPSVVMGIVIQGSSATQGAANVPFMWALVVVPQGTTVSAIATANQSTLYAPEAMVLAFGTGTVTAGAIHPFYIKTKTGRKINAGDTIQFTMVSTTANAVQHTYTIQFFLKTG